MHTNRQEVFAVKSLVIYAHPNPLSFNAALAKVTEEELARKGEVRVKDLYRMNWNPVLSEQDFKGFHLGMVCLASVALKTSSTGIYFPYLQLVMQIASRC